MKKALKIAGGSVLAILLFPVILLAVLYASADMAKPDLTLDFSRYQPDLQGDTLVCGDSYLRRDSSGLWELYVTGSGEERGAKQGALTTELMKYQEDVFIDQIRRIVPSDRYLGLLRTFIVVFNRHLGKHIPLEYRQEIAAMSEYCTHDYDAIGTPYERQLNYHAAHDIGHTMQQYMLVGCSSFGAWGGRTEGNSMIVGRNFDFYVGEDFARNKLITFAVPDSGYRYASVGWAGMIGVLSGMNQAGLTVTLNAAKGAIPTSAATPISILAREILQYAATIEQAYEIAASRETFVSESLLIGSAVDGRCAVIEKTPAKTALYTPSGETIVCTNHFQSDEFSDDPYNVENIRDSDSPYRYQRLQQLLGQSERLDYREAVAILRDRFGMDGADVGIGNEMTLNQSIAHHAVVFMPQAGMMWVSTRPWQSGRMVCYDLRSFFDGGSAPVREAGCDVAEDTLFINRELPLLNRYRQGIKEIEDAIENGVRLDDAFMESFLSANPNHYYTYRIMGEYFASRNETTRAVEMYRRAVGCPIPTRSEREEIMKKMRR